MDGNRRFAVKCGLHDRRLGHYHGYGRFEQVLEWCFDLGIKYVTVYAFSVENFKRSEKEVSTLMELAAEKLAKLATHSDMIRKNRVAIRIIGELDMLPENVRSMAIKAMRATANYHNFILNICFPYVSRMEMDRAEKSFKQLLADRTLCRHSDPALYRSGLDTFDAPDVDILVRTSGEYRLSEFMLHQLCVSPRCYYAFVKVMWPEFSMVEFGKILLKYQQSCAKKDMAKVEWEVVPASLKAKRRQQLVDYCKSAKHCEDVIGR
jgi:ditrans,polycis-polyprenyl diphosphate synthase